jgi:hypothetical protein
MRPMGIPGLRSRVTVQTAFERFAFQIMVNGSFHPLASMAAVTVMLSF